MAKVVQYSIDIEIEDTDKFDADDIERTFESYWYAEGIKNREVLGVAWKATWNSSESYHRSMPPDSWD